jgi:hypothetical protein
LTRGLGLLGCALALALPMPGNARPDSPASPVVGPSSLCFKYSRFDLVEGESAADFGAGTETMSLKVTARTGSFRIGESEIYVQPRRRGRLVFSAEGTSIYRTEQGSDVGYAVYGHADFLGDGDRHIVSLSGPSFTGGKGDAAIYRRVRIGDFSATKCGMRYLYGWDVILSAMEGKP